MLAEQQQQPAAACKPEPRFGIAREIFRGDYDYHWFQCDGGPRFDAKRHRVFHLPSGGAEWLVCARTFAAINEWLAAEGWDIDGWYSLRDHGGSLGRAVWRFRAGQEAEAEAFARRWCGQPHGLTSSIN